MLLHGLLVAAQVLLAAVACTLAYELPIGVHNTTTAQTWDAYFGLFPPRFYDSESATQTDCYSAYVRLQQERLSCSAHGSTLSAVEVQHCSYSSSSGSLVLRRLGPPQPNQGTAIYRLRVVGPEGVHLLPVIYCAPNLAVAAYEFKQPGQYAIEVLQLYQSFSFSAPNTSLFQYPPWLGFLTVTIAAANTYRSSASTSTTTTSSAAAVWSESLSEHLRQRPQTALPIADGLSSALMPQQRPASTLRRPSPSSLPLCPASGPLPGRWLFTRWPSDAALPLLCTCIWGDAMHDCQHPQQRPLQTTHDALEWQPHGCRLLPLDDPATGAAAPLAATCLSRRRTCFVGDSHARFAHNTLVVWSSRYTLTVNHTAKIALDSPTSLYLKMLWGHDWDIADASSCTDVVVNFGQWPASYRAGASPWPPGVYLRHLRTVRSMLLRLRARGKRVYWLTTVPPSLKARHEAASIDWRTDPLLLLYNRMALGEMRAVDISIVDTWGLSTALMDQTMDGIHYGERGVVGRGILNAVVHSLCAPDAGAAAGGAGRPGDEAHGAIVNRAASSRIRSRSRSLRGRRRLRGQRQRRQQQQR